jgi:hypothetical protein
MNIKVKPKNEIYSIKLLYLGCVPREDTVGDGQETKNLQSMALNGIVQCMVDFVSAYVSYIDIPVKE